MTPLDRERSVSCRGVRMEMVLASYDTTQSIPTNLIGDPQEEDKCCTAHFRAVFCLSAGQV